MGRRARRQSACLGRPRNTRSGALEAPGFGRGAARLLRAGPDAAFNPVSVSDRLHQHRAGIPARNWLGPLVAYLIALPWYAPRDWIDPTFWALPIWAVASVAGSVLLALCTARALLVAWPDDEAEMPAARAGEDPAIKRDEP